MKYKPEYLSRSASISIGNLRTHHPLCLFSKPKVFAMVICPLMAPIRILHYPPILRISHYPPSYGSYTTATILRILHYPPILHHPYALRDESNLMFLCSHSLLISSKLMFFLSISPSLSIRFFVCGLKLPDTYRKAI